MKVIIPTCDKYIGVAIRAHKHTFDKNLKDLGLEVVVLGYKEPKFDLGDWEFFSLGRDTGPRNFSNDISKFFYDFDEDLFIFANDDIVIMDNPDASVLATAKNLFRNKKVGRVCLTSAWQNKNCSLYANILGHKVSKKSQDAEYRLSLHYSMWRTSYFKRYLKPNMTPWDMDTNEASKNDGFEVLGFHGSHFIDFGHLYRKNRLASNWYKSLYTRRSLSESDHSYVLKIIQGEI